MAQPIKSIQNNPWNTFSKELTSLIDFITSEITPVFGTNEITPEIFIYGALENPDCMLYKAVNCYLTSFDIDFIHDHIGKRGIKKDGVIIGGSIDFSKTMIAVLTDANEEKNVTKSQYIASDHVLLSMLKNDKCKELSKLFTNNGLSYEIMVTLSGKVHDVIVNDIPKIEVNQETKKEKKKKNPFISGFDLGKNGEEGTIHMVIGGMPGTTPDINEMFSSMFANTPLGNKNNKAKNNEASKDIEFCTNLNEVVRTTDVDELVGREKELNTIFNVLGRKKCNNVLLIGEQGVGKTQCVYGLASRINQGNVPIDFKDKEIWKLNAAEIVAGTQLRGMFEERIVKLVKQFKSNKDKILFIDDIDNIFGNKKSSAGDYDVGGALSELFIDGTTQIIGTVSYKGFKAIADNDPDIAKKFQQVVIEKPSLDECLNILMNTKSTYEKFHRVVYPDEVIKQLVTLTNRYITDKMLPSSAIDVLDELGSYKKLNSQKSLFIRDLLDYISKCNIEKEEAIKNDNITKANELTMRINDARTDIAKTTTDIREGKPQVITLDDLYKVMSEHTNIPISKLSVSEKQELKHISDTLKKVVIGQDNAIDIISRAIKRNKIGITSSVKPRLSVLCIGQSGVGKTLIAKTLAKEIYGDEKYLVRFDMSEYSDETSVNKLVGSSAGYVGYTEGGLLTEAIKNKKYCVLLIDELEKAHDKVYNLFLQILDEGFLTDNMGQKVDFRNTIVIMTSNVGAKKAANSHSIGFENNDNTLKEDILRKELKNKFPPEFLNRIDDIVYFNPLTDDNLKSIIRLELGYLDARMKKIGHSITYTDDVVENIFKIVSEEKEYGARPIHRALRDKIENKITDLLIDNDYENHIFEISVKENELEVI